MISTINETWKTHIEQKLSELPAGGRFIFYTDAHEGDVHEGGRGKGCYESLELVEYIAGKAHIKHVIYGGDVLGSEKTIDDAKKYMNKFFTDKEGLYDRFGSNAIVNLGNHDTNCVAWSYIKAKREGFNWDYKLADILLTDSFIYENYIKPMETSGKIGYDNIGIDAVKSYFSNLDIQEFRDAFEYLGYDKHMQLSDDELRQYFVNETEAMFKFHYTYTDGEERIKYIVLDCGTNSPMQYGIIKQDYTDIFHIQFYWLAQELINTPEGYDIVVSSHMLGDNPEKGPVYKPEDLFKNTDNKIFDMTNVTAPIYEILTAYKGRRAITMPDSANVQKDNRVLKGIVDAIKNAYINTDGIFQGVSADFNTSHKVGKIVTLSGHWHLDKMFVVSQELKVSEYHGEKITDQIPVIFTAASSVKRKSPFLVMSCDAPNSACFDVITFTENKVALTRIGVGEDRELTY